MAKGKSFRYFIDLDSTTVFCPCGSSVCNDSGDIGEFEKKHMEHTNGCVISHITDDGARCLADTYPRNRSYSLNLPNAQITGPKAPV
jgi:hypothetical protein